MGDRSEPDQTSQSTAIRDGGYGWVVVFACFVQTFWVNAWTGSWGIIQAALLLQSNVRAVPTSTISFVGSLGLSLTVALGLACVWLAGVIGARWSSLIGVVLFGASTLVGSFTVSNIGGLFISAALYGLGASLMFTMSNSLPLQWFNDRLGTANGLVKLGGGVGATVMAFVLQQLIDKVGIAWTFRVMALMSLASGIPTALLIRERAPPSSSSINMSLFRNLTFFFLFVAGFVGIFALYIPSFFLPTVATSIGLSSTTAAAVMACYNACMALGPVTMLAIWSVASTLAALVIFAALNGIANGAFFVTMPTAVGRLLGPYAAPAGIGMAITGWSVGDLLGNPIAGFLIAATHAGRANSIVPYRAAIFYAGGTAAVSTALVLVARLRMDASLIKKY
ncbi:putative monocarboxylate permease [Aspergillus nomiae NRRL 13137]|uniref:Putative monocarboxylate permease n=1 Tax=Aspergillus nomiae NRRL (strain ATCC 15546 / NRRL 13137 / CBS 260.88 / M93) TaxID=1509407 RepID=A0A0L1IX75_ASPN3|nr:putative monocarboxylate permease [Aspergillus nomiae NRRL 13137]KNG83783.1 putative monocarboxylate permease [Aspergillus nomiae NRRL 13137]